MFSQSIAWVMVILTPNASPMRDIAIVASSESPPMSRKLSCLPIQLPVQQPCPDLCQGRFRRGGRRLVLASLGASASGATTALSRSNMPILCTFPVGPLGMASTSQTFTGTLK